MNCVHARGQNTNKTPANLVRHFVFSLVCGESEWVSEWSVVASRVCFFVLRLLILVTYSSRRTLVNARLHFFFFHYIFIIWINFHYSGWLTKNCRWKISFAFCTQSMADFVSAVSCLISISWMKFHGHWCDANEKCVQFMRSVLVVGVVFSQFLYFY